MSSDLGTTEITIKRLHRMIEILSSFREDGFNCFNMTTGYNVEVPTLLAKRDVLEYLNNRFSSRSISKSMVVWQNPDEDFCVFMYGYNDFRNGLRVAADLCYECNMDGRANVQAYFDAFRKWTKGTDE